MVDTEQLLVIDAGTGGCRAVVFDTAGRITARAYRAWGYYAPAGLELYGKQFDPDEFWKLILECLAEVLSVVGPESIVAVSSTSMRQGCVFVDKSGQALYGGPNLDARGMEYAIEIESALGREETCALTGHWPPWISMAARLYWFREEQPAIYKLIDKALSINDWILYKLCGNAVSEPTNACETLLLDLQSREWSGKIIEALAIDPAVLPRIAAAGQVIGKVTDQASGQTGLLENTLVVTGAADSQLALLGSGVSQPGQVGVVAGTTAPVMMALDERLFDSSGKLWTNCHVSADRWLLESNCGDAGKILRWYVEDFFSGLRTDPYSELIASAETIAPGSDGVRSFLGPMIWNIGQINPSRPSALLMPFPFESANATAGHLMRAIIENIAYAIRGNLEQIVDCSSIEPVSFTLCGGLTRAELLGKIVAAVLDRPVEVSACKEASALGGAMLAAWGCGLFNDLDQAFEAMKPEFFEIAPDPDWAEEYDSCYDIWKEQYEILEQEF